MRELTAEVLKSARRSGAERRARQARNSAPVTVTSPAAAVPEPKGHLVPSVRRGALRTAGKGALVGAGVGVVGAAGLHAVVLHDKHKQVKKSEMPGYPDSGPGRLPIATPMKNASASVQAKGRSAPVSSPIGQKPLTALKLSKPLVVAPPASPKATTGTQTRRNRAGAASRARTGKLIPTIRAVR